MAKLWDGRFSEETDAVVNHFNASIGFDQRLWRHDIKGSVAHVRMLGKCAIISEADARAIEAGLISVRDDIEAGKSTFTEAAEDVHMNIETLLTAKIGVVAGKLHTGRSRNDQVATDIRLWLKDEIDVLQGSLQGLQGRLIQLAEDHVDVILPGMTHMQHAQPIRLAHHLMAYFWMLSRDVERLADARRRTDVLPLGSGALAGVTYPIDREFVAQELGFAQITKNSLDGVSDRDFAIETVSALSILMMHLSRLSEELILWNCPEFGWIALGDNVTTGSSIMPQKKNPDVLELVRGKTGRTFGSLMSLLTVLKGLPLAYNKDLQEDKEPLFDAVDTAKMCIDALCVLFDNIVFQKGRMAAALSGDFSTATDLADFLVRQGLPFRQAHEIVGKIVRYCIDKGIHLEDVDSSALQQFSELFRQAPVGIAAVETSVESRNIPGGVALSAVLEQIRQAKAVFGS